MSLDRGRIQRQGHRVLTQFGQSLEDAAPSTALGPAIEPIVDRRVGPVFMRTIAPARARLQHMDDAADDAPVVLASRPRQAMRQMRLQPLPLPIVQPEQTLAHPSPPANQLAVRESLNAN